jgi:LmbE family N-acetylglucosaminyl deacetylase
MKTVLAIAAHPDDIEFVMAGTLMHLKQAGYELHYWNLANGCCGSTETDRVETASIRKREAIDASEYLEAIFHASICSDLQIFYDKPTLAKVASVVRQVNPQIVLTHALSDYMEDHMNAARLAVTAAFCRSMPNFPVTPPELPVASPVTVYHAQPHGNRDPLGQRVLPTRYVDCSDVIEQKCEMLAMHASQKQWLDQSQGQDSYLETMKSLNAEVGKMSGQFRYAEGWRKHLHYGFCEERADPLVEALGEHVVVTDAE